jgi:hypothetical protein
VGEDQGYSVPTDRPFVDEVDAQVPELRSELVEAVQPALLSAPIESIRPVRDQAAEVREIGALLPRPAWRLIRPPRPSQPRHEVPKDLIRNLYRERLDEKGGCTLAQLDPPFASNEVALTPSFADRRKRGVVRSEAEARLGPAPGTMFSDIDGAAQPESGVGREITTYTIPIEGRDDWLAAARRLA